jgi:secretion/DNA translocation related CpaE-like protein
MTSARLVHKMVPHVRRATADRATVAFMSPPLFVTSDDVLLEELSRLAAAAGTTPEVARDVAAALRGWSRASLVLVGYDLAGALAHAGPTRRDAVFVVLSGPVPDRAFQVALSLGAESVAELPRSEGWLVERLTDVDDSGPARGLTIGVVGGSGGSGATTFACALGQVAGRSGPSVVLDADPFGPGTDRVLGLDLVEGVRWEALGHTTGRLSARALRESLPRRDGVAALTWYAGSKPVRLQPFAAREALSAARRGHDTVVIDLPRAPDPFVDEIASRCDQVLLTVVATVAGVAAAMRMRRRFVDPDLVRLVVRGSGMDDESLARVVGAPVLTRMNDQRGLVESIDLGLGPVRSRRGALGRAATRVLNAVGESLPRAA